MSESNEETNERSLVDQLRARDSIVQAKLYRRYRRSLWRQALKIVGDPVLAEDLVHEAWIRAMASIDSFEGRSRLGTWLVSIVLNQARRHRRREARFRPLSARRALRSWPMSGALEDHLGNDPLQARIEETPETILLGKEAAHRMERALDTLTRRQRSVVVLRDFQGVSPAEACDVLEITDVAQRVHLSRARATLRRAFADDERLCA